MTTSIINKNNEKVNLDQLEQVSGGSLFSDYSDKEYAAAGITVDGPGLLFNDGYIYNGKDITSFEATVLTYYSIHEGKRASSIEVARRYYDARHDSHSRRKHIY